MTTGPLTGVRVIEIAQWIAVPAATMTMAELGADVIKVEPPEGDGARRVGRFGDAMFIANNRGKRSMVVDLKSPAGAGTLRQLVGSADLLAHNVLPRSAAALGLTPSSLRAHNDRLIVCSLSGFGLNGPDRDRAGLDIAAQAESGMMSVTGEEGGDPMKVGFPIVDAAAAQVLFGSAMTALFERERGGIVRDVHVSLMQVAVSLQGQLWAEYSTTGAEPRRQGNRQAAVAPAADLLKVADGQIVLSAYMPSHWQSLCTALDLEDLRSDPRFADAERRAAVRDELIATLEQRLAHMTMDQCVALLAGHGVVVGAVRRPTGVLDSVWASSEAGFVDVESGGRRHRLAASAHGLGPSSDDTMRVPALGEHTDAVLAELAER